MKTIRPLVITALKKRVREGGESKKEENDEAQDWEDREVFLTKEESQNQPYKLLNNYNQNKCEMSLFKKFQRKRKKRKFF